MSDFLITMGNFWWSMSVSMNSLEVENDIILSLLYCKYHYFLNIHYNGWYANNIVHKSLTHFIFLLRNILYHLDEKTSQFSILLEAWEHGKSLTSNETFQEALSKVLHSINSAQVYFKAGLDVFDSVLVGKNWENSQHFKKFVYSSSSKSSNLVRFPDIEDLPPTAFYTNLKLLLDCIFNRHIKEHFAHLIFFLYLHFWICKSKLLK